MLKIITHDQHEASTAKWYYKTHEKEWQASRILDDARELIKNAPLEQYVVLIPVAAHQEESVIYHTLREYARQERTDTFSIVLNMNWPVGADESAVSRCFSELERAKADFPLLDIRAIQYEYTDETPMGTIRGDLWDTVFAAGIEGGTLGPDKEMFAFNHDIDTEKIPRQLIEIVRSHYTAQRKAQAQELLRPIETRMIHGFDRGSPNSSRAIRWMDTIYDIMNGGYDASLVVPMGQYANAEGMSRHIAIGELQRTLEKVGLMKDIVTIPTPAIVTSPRRAVHRINEGFDYHEIWSNGSFHSTEKFLDTAITPSHDIATPELHQLTANFASDTLDLAFYRRATLMMMRTKLRERTNTERFDRIDVWNASDADVMKYTDILHDSITTSATIAYRALTNLIEHPDAESLVAKAIAGNSRYRKP